MSNQRKILIEFITADIDRYGNFLITRRVGVNTIEIESPIRTIRVSWKEVPQDLIYYGIDYEKKIIEKFKQELENE